MRLRLLLGLAWFATASANAAGVIATTAQDIGHNPKLIGKSVVVRACYGVPMNDRPSGALERGLILLYRCQDLAAMMRENSNAQPDPSAFAAAVFAEPRIATSLLESHYDPECDNQGEFRGTVVRMQDPALGPQPLQVLKIAQVRALKKACRRPAASIRSPAGGSHSEHAQPVEHMQAQPGHIAAYREIMATMHKQMSAGIQAQNADVAFAQGMIPHHRGAVAMAQVELRYGKDAQMRALAQKIIQTQQGEIKQMQQWLANNASTQPADANKAQILQAFQAGVVKNHQAMMQGMEADPDIAFAKGMIPHHQGAVDMAHVEGQYGKNPQMRRLAEQIKQAQNPEIKQMQDWLAQKGVQ